MEAIATAGLTKDYGQGRGIFDLNLSVHRGEAFGLIGPNGAGKTTTLRLLMDLIRPTRGTATIMGMDTGKEGVAIRRLTGFVPGEAPDYPNHTGERILNLIANLRGGIDPQRINSLANQLDLDLRRKYREYSHGNKQKVWLIQAFMHDAELLILDEPTIGLDPLLQQAFRQLVAQAQQRGTTVLLSSHVLPEVQEICQRIGVIYRGHMRQVGTLDELRLSEVRQIRVRFTGTIDAEALRSVAGLRDLAITGQEMRCTMSGRMAPLLAALQDVAVITLDSNEMNLEEVFLAQYGQPAA